MVGTVLASLPLVPAAHAQPIAPTAAPAPAAGDAPSGPLPATGGGTAPGPGDQAVAPGSPQWDLASLAQRATPAAPAAAAGPALPAPPPPPPPLACPGDCLPPAPRAWADHVPEAGASHRGFWQQAGAVKTESLLFLGYFSLMSGQKLFKETRPFHFKDEGWFGKDTDNIGVDKLTHAFDTYLLTEFLHQQIHRRTGGSQGDAVTAAVLASGLMIFNEFSDGIETDSGFSFQDVAMNLAGAGFSALRNTVPGLKEKVSFKIEIVPNRHVYSYRGKPHYQQQRYMFSIKGAGFPRLARTPLRLVDLQLGYFASDFLLEDRAAGRSPRRHLFVGLGLNAGELLFGNARSGFGRAGYKVLDYLQLPYTSIRYDTTGRLGH